MFDWESAKVGQMTTHRITSPHPQYEPGSSILQVNSYDIDGGAESVSMNLFCQYLDRGYHSSLLVGTKRGSDPRVMEIDRGLSHNFWERLWLTKSGRLKPAKERSTTNQTKILK